MERLSQIVCCSKSNIKEKRTQQKKHFQDVTTRLASDKQANNWPTISFETENFPFEKKNKPWSDSNPGTLSLQPYLQAKLAGNA